MRLARRASLAFRRALRRSRVWVGLGLIVLSAVAIGTSTPFPGVAALLPTIGAGLVILAGLERSPRRDQVAAGPASAAFLGRISYSLYLWHWPLLVLPAAALGTALPLPATLALAALAIPIAAASQRWVEEPIRHGRFVGLVPRRSLAAAGALTLVLVVTSATLGGAAEDRLGVAASTGVVASSEVDDFIEAQMAPPAAPTRADVPAPRATAQATPRPGALRGPCAGKPRAALVDAKQDRPDDLRRRLPRRSLRQRTPGECVFGDPDAHTTVVLMGDSHAAQWFPALDALGRERNWRLVSLTKSGCPPAEVTIWVGTFERAYTECDTWRDAVFERIADLQPDLVVVSMTYGQTPIVDGETLDGEPAREVMIEAYERTLDHLDTIAGRVALLADTPRAPDDPPICLSSHLDDALSCATARQDAVEGEWLEEQEGVARSRRGRIRRPDAVGLPRRPVSGGDRALPRVPRHAPPHDDVRDGAARPARARRCPVPAQRRLRGD